MGLQILMKIEDIKSNYSLSKLQGVIVGPNLQECPRPTKMAAVTVDTPCIRCSMFIVLGVEFVLAQCFPFSKF